MQNWMVRQLMNDPTFQQALTNRTAAGDPHAEQVTNQIEIVRALKRTHQPTSIHFEMPCRDLAELVAAYLTAHNELGFYFPKGHRPTA